MMNPLNHPPRKAAQERREEIVTIAIEEFSQKGFYGASTVTIAERAAISHPNLFRLFPTKKALFITVMERVVERIKHSMIGAGQRSPDDPQAAMARGYRALLSHRELMLLLLQGYAACQDEEILEVMRRLSTDVFRQIEVLLDGNTPQARDFYAQGMLLTIATAMRLPEIASDHTWAAKFLAPQFFKADD